MSHPALFVGVVSHEGSRFAMSQGPEGLAHQLATMVPGAVVRVNSANLLDERQLPVTPGLVQASLTAELRADAAWSRYLGRAQGLRWWVGQGLRWGRRAWRVIRPPTEATVRRLLNIELSHVDLMRAGLASGAPWVLILEDDAMAADVADLAQGLAGLMRTDHRVGFVNISRSFDLATLGIDHLLTQAVGTSWAGSVSRAVLVSSRPVTNTVCAILYSRSFLEHLISVWDTMPVTPVVPIDWKLNLALIHMFESGQMEAGSCWLIDPAPITQMSMQPAGILPA